jgi:hypothetical protein
MRVQCKGALFSSTVNLERATDHKCIIIAACQKKHQVWEFFKFNGLLFFREEEKLAA